MAAGGAVIPDLGPDPRRRIGRSEFDFSRQVVAMAIVNRTRDSFYDHGANFEFGNAMTAVEAALDVGAPWIDIGAVPFSPLSEEVTEPEELSRLLPVVEATRDRTDAVISVDTFRPRVAREVLAAGADAINDTSGLRNLEMARVAARAGAALIITHSKAAPREHVRRPSYVDVVEEVRSFLQQRAAEATAEGVRREQIVVDPGHDLNKNTYHSLELTRRLDQFTNLGYPVLASVSNKDFLGETLNLPRDRLRDATIATLVICILRGARILRVHDVGAALAAIGMTEAILGWRPPASPRHNLE